MRRAELRGSNRKHGAPCAEVRDAVAGPDHVVQQTDDTARRRMLARAERHSWLDDNRRRRIESFSEPRWRNRERAERLRMYRAFPLLRPVDVWEWLCLDACVRTRRHRGTEQRVRLGLR